MSETRYGAIRVDCRNPEDSVVFAFSYQEGTDPDKAISEAIAEMRGDTKLRAYLREEFCGPVTLRDLTSEMQDEPFNRRGITFLPIFCEYEMDGDELLDGYEEVEGDPA